MSHPGMRDVEHWYITTCEDHRRAKEAGDNSQVMRSIDTLKKIARELDIDGVRYLQRQIQRRGLCDSYNPLRFKH